MGLHALHPGDVILFLCILHILQCNHLNLSYWNNFSPDFLKCYLIFNIATEKSGTILIFFLNLWPHHTVCGIEPGPLRWRCSLNSLGHQKLLRCNLNSWAFVTFSISQKVFTHFLSIIMLGSNGLFKLENYVLPF